MQVDIDIHAYQFLARKAFGAYINRCVPPLTALVLDWYMNRCVSGWHNVSTFDFSSCMSSLCPYLHPHQLWGLGG